MATYAIGDVQGCYDELRRLLDHAGFDATRDRLWFVGDLVNRGAQSLETLRFVRALGERAITVLGNHDLHLLARAYGLAKPRADDTLEDVLAAADRDALLDWLRSLPLLHVERDLVMVHAGLLPQWSLAKARMLAGEVESALRGDRYRDFFANLYGSEPARWDDSLVGPDRLRVIVNAMTRLRFCTAEGVMDFHAKGETDAAPPGFMPWFDVPSRASRSHTVVCGHWSALGLRVRADLLALDSGCVWGGALSALRLEDRQVFQVDCATERRA
jgi:bis(5'-nucleosyl)-tetraphosphatase (symmetrical)